MRQRTHTHTHTHTYIHVHSSRYDDDDDEPVVARKVYSSQITIHIYLFINSIRMVFADFCKFELCLNRTKHNREDEEKIFFSNI